MTHERSGLEHFGKVTGYSDGAYLVEVRLRTDECGGCSAAAFCGSSGRETLTLKAFCDKGLATSLIGRRVRVRATESDRVKAVILLLLLPLAILLTVAIVLNSMGAGDIVSGLSAIIASALVYLIIFIFQRKKRLQWTIIEIL